MQKWEYCVIKGVETESVFRTLYPYLTKFTIDDPKGYTVQKLEKTSSEPEETVVAKTIAKLGIDGWEMVNAIGERLFFKRPIP